MNPDARATEPGAVEERPGIPPSPGHLARLIQQMKEDKVKVVVVEPWSDQKLAGRQYVRRRDVEDG